MKRLLFLLVLTLIFGNAYSQSDSILQFIFVPHPRSEDKVHQTVLPSIEKIDFTKYNMIFLGGDITYYTSINRVSMDYCNNLFNLGSPNTLWTMGNHDLSSPALVEEYTGRKRFYTYFRDGITFMVLDTELDSEGFNSSFISGDQLEMIKTVSDTISTSATLIVLHGRLIWMVDNPVFYEKIDSVAESTKQLDTTNFFQEVYPLLQIISNKGINVYCLGGDKSKINIEYFTEDNIVFLTSTMAPEFPDSINDVMVFKYNQNTSFLSWNFVRLDKIEKKNSNPVFLKHSIIQPNYLKVSKFAGTMEICVELSSESKENELVQVYSISGVLCYSVSVKPGEKIILPIKNEGVYIVRNLTDLKTCYTSVILPVTR